MRKLWTIVFLLAGLQAGQTCYAEEEHTHPHPGPASELARGMILPQDLWKRITVGFLLEIEGFAGQVGDESKSDIVLATAEATADAVIVDGVLAHLGLLWEEDDTEEDNLDEAYLTLGATESIPFYLTAGKLYLPVGNFESAFISDPLPLELAEIRESAALAGYANDLLNINAGAFNGDFNEVGSDDTVDAGFASIMFSPTETLVFGAYWFSDLLDADGFESVAGDPAVDYDTYAAAGAFMNATIASLVLNAEYVAALESIDLPSGGQRPSAYNVEASMPLCKTVSGGIKLEGSDGFYAAVGTDKFPDWRSGFVVSYTLNPNIVFSGEYLHAEGLDNDESGDMVTLQVAVVL